VDTAGLLVRIRELDDSFAGIGDMASELPPADVAELVNQLTLQEAASVLSVLPIARAAEVLNQSTLTRRSALVEALEASRSARILEELSADERAEIVRGVGDNARRRLLPKLSAEVRAEIERLLRYPAYSAGGIMTTEFVRLDPGMNVSEALRHIRSVAREKESIYACYVMDPQTERLLGAVSLRDPLMAELSQRVTEVMRKKPVTVSALDDRESVAAKIAKYNLLAVPVLEMDGRVADS
jgi:magnesium transporter